MSERGVFAVDRGIWSDPDFADELFSEREAFLWLVGEAAWRPVRVRVGSAVVDLVRGECAFSTRFMAAKWKWSEARVRRYLGRLQKSQIIDARADAHATRISIRKYDRFQRVSLPSDAPADAEATHLRRTDDAPATQERRKEEDRENIKGNSSLRSEARTHQRRKPETPVDPNWVLTPELIAAAENCGLSRGDAAAEWPRFIDHALAKDVRHRDWVAAWRNWCRSPYRKPHANGHGPPGERMTGATRSALAKAQRPQGAHHAPTLNLESKPFPSRHREPASDRRGGGEPDEPVEGGSSGGGVAALLDFPDAAPSDEERAWLLDRRDLIAASLQAAEFDDLHDRLHGFAFSFGRVRGLDEFAFNAYLRNLTEAVDEYSVEVVARACRAWNKGRFSWANRKFEPEPAEMERACAQMKAEMCREAREVESIAGAEVMEPPPPALTKQQRDEVNAEIEKRLRELGVVDPLTSRLMRQEAREADLDEEQRLARRRDVARDLEARRQRNEALPESERLNPPALAPSEAKGEQPA